MSNWDPTNEHLAAEGYDSEGVEAVEAMQNVVSAREALDALFGATCVCGKSKPYKKSHCRACYLKLPKGLQRRLYNLIGQGYEEAYTESRDFLLRGRSK